MADFIKNTWKPKPNEVAIRFHMKDLSGWLSKSLTIQTGVEGLLYHKGQYVSALKEGTHPLDSKWGKSNRLFIDLNNSIVLYQSQTFTIDIIFKAQTIDCQEVIIQASVDVRISDGRAFQTFFMTDKDSVSIFHIKSPLLTKIQKYSKKYMWKQSINYVKNQPSVLIEKLSDYLEDEVIVNEKKSLSNIDYIGLTSCLDVTGIEIQSIKNNDLLTESKGIIEYQRLKNKFELDNLKAEEELKQLEITINRQRKELNLQEALENEKREKEQDDFNSELIKEAARVRRDAILVEIKEKIRSDLKAKEKRLDAKQNEAEQTRIHDSRMREIKNDAILAQHINDAESRKKEFDRIQIELDNEFERVQNKKYLKEVVEKEKEELDLSLYRTVIRTRIKSIEDKLEKERKDKNEDIRHRIKNNKLKEFDSFLEICNKDSDKKHGRLIQTIETFKDIPPKKIRAIKNFLGD